MRASLWLLLLLCGSASLTACSGGSSGAPAVARLSVTTPPSATADGAFIVTVTALDANNNPAGSYSGTVHFSSTDGQAVLPANSALTGGTGTFSATLRTAGSQTISAADAVTASITGTSSSIDVNSGPATHFAISAPSTTQSGTSVDFTVTALDAANNVVKGYTGTAHFSSTDGQAVLPANATLSDGAGTFSVLLRAAGSQSVSATDTDTASITGTSSPIEVNPGPPVQLSVSAPTTVHSGTTFNFTVTALDASSNVANSYTGTVHFTSTDNQAVLPADSALTNGMESVSATLQTLGTQTITATDTVTASITGTSSSITVGPPLPAIHFLVSTPTTAQSAIAFNFTVTALDAANTVAASYTGTVHFTSTDNQAALPTDATLTNGVGSFSATLQTSGSQTITSMDTVTASFTGTSSPVEVGAGPTTHLSVIARSPERAGTPFSFLVSARDAANNVATSYAGTVHFTSTDANATLPADSTLVNGIASFSATLRTTGSRTITATDTATASITDTSNAIEVYVNCGIRGEECGFQPYPRCCPGLTCAAATVRFYCL
jgi:hypothetical protein